MNRWSKILVYTLAGLIVLAGTVWGVGLRLPVEHTVTVSADVPGDLEEVWALLADVRDYPAWRPEVQDVRVLSDSGTLVWRERTTEGTVSYRRVQAERPRRLVVEIADPNLPYGGRWIYTLIPTGTSTRVSITEEGEVYNPLFRFFSKFVFGHDAAARSFLESLRVRLERESGPGR